MKTAVKAIWLVILMSLAAMALGEPVVEFNPSPLIARYRSQCGNPEYESMLWRPISGDVIEVPDGHTVVLVVDGNHSKRTIRLVAIQSPDVALPENEIGRRTLEGLALGKHAGVLVNPSIDLTASLDAEVTGVVKVAGTDVNFRMIELGLASFQQPKPYSMSNFVACTYRLVGKEARNERRGIWKGLRGAVSN